MQTRSRIRLPDTLKIIQEVKFCFSGLPQPRSLVAENYSQPVQATGTRQRLPEECHFCNLASQPSLSLVWKMSPPTRVVSSSQQPNFKYACMAENLVAEKQSPQSTPCCTFHDSNVLLPRVIPLTPSSTCRHARQFASQQSTTYQQ